MITNKEVWRRCFEHSWQGLIDPRSYRHPAKFSYGVIEKIVLHLAENNWIKKDDVVLDPFAGVGCGGIVCTNLKLRWLGVEIEKKFVELARRNFEHNARRWIDGKRFLPLIFEGDSRRLNITRQSISAVVSAPPSLNLINDSGTNEGSGAHGEPHRRGRDNASSQQGYGHEYGQLVDLSDVRIDAVITSPPYGSSTVRQSLRQNKDDYDWGQHVVEGYGDSEGQLTRLRETLLADITDSCDSNTFWYGAREVLRRCHEVLKPGGVAVWNVCDFVRDNKRVHFADDWLRLCQMCGFELLCRHKATKVEVTQETGLITTDESRKERKSFFRRLAESRGAPRIDEEDVVCTRKVG